MWEPEIRRKALQESATFLQRSFFNVDFSLVAAQLLVKMKNPRCSVTSAVQHSENCSTTSVFACGMLQGWGLEGWRLTPICANNSRTSKNRDCLAQGPLNGGVSNGGVSRSGLFCPFLSLFVLFRTFPIFLGFSRFARGWSGDFPDSSFSSFSAY